MIVHLKNLLSGFVIPSKFRSGLKQYFTLQLSPKIISQPVFFGSCTDVGSLSLSS